jgi:hypothetical protein
VFSSFGALSESNVVQASPTSFRRFELPGPGPGPDSHRQDRQQQQQQQPPLRPAEERVSPPASTRQTVRFAAPSSPLGSSPGRATDLPSRKRPNTVATAIAGGSATEHRAEHQSDLLARHPPPPFTRISTSEDLISDKSGRAARQAAALVAATGGSPPGSQSRDPRHELHSQFLSISSDCESMMSHNSARRRIQERAGH